MLFVKVEQHLSDLLACLFSLFTTFETITYPPPLHTKVLTHPRARTNSPPKIEIPILLMQFQLPSLRLGWFHVFLPLQETVLLLLGDMLPSIFSVKSLQHLPDSLPCVFGISWRFEAITELPRFVVKRHARPSKYLDTPIP